MSEATATLDAQETQIVGGWSPFREVTKLDLMIFDEAIRPLLGVDYTPLEVSTQIVNGTNYRFIAESKVVIPGAASQLCMISIYEPIDGDPVVTSIKMLDTQMTTDLPGGWSDWATPDAESLEVFDTAIKGLVGVSYAPEKVSKQVVAGMNYRFLCNAKVVAPGSESFQAIVEIFQPLSGDPVITDIERIS